MVGEDHPSKRSRQAKKKEPPGDPASAPLADHFAVHDLPPGEPVPGAVLLLEDGAVAVFRGTPQGEARRGTRVGPVYRSAKGRLVVPTGRVLVRFHEGVRADDRRRAIEAAGYEVEGVLPYAPHAAWVRGKGGDIGDSLAGIDALRGLGDVDHVEPQLLSPSSPRAGTGS
jgi:hypothetical protein